jgi:hypothetical protein
MKPYIYAFVTAIFISMLAYMIMVEPESAPKIKVEYYVEIVSEDSIKVQSVYGPVYSGSFNDFEEIILKDNL